jgi:hypothetical protein
MKNQNPALISTTYYKYGRLGRELKISPKSNFTVLEPGHKREYFTSQIEVTIGIGKNETASLIMSTDAWEAFKQNEEIIIETTKQFKSKIF